MKISSDNSPSKKHIWEVHSQNVDRCKRCGSMFHRQVDGRSAVYCVPTPKWLKENPNDDRKER